MNRRYTTDEFEKGVQLLRKKYPNVALTTDVIVGFPGETEDEFNLTFEFLKKIKFYKMHIFKYSQRKGTKAAVMPNQIDGKVKEERSRKLIELSNKFEKEYNREYIGKTVQVLLEEQFSKDGIKFMKGHTTNYILVEVKNDENLENTIKNIGIDDVHELGLTGHIK